jgi:PAS domain S-box-containing protein
LILKADPQAMQPDARSFGNTARPSAAIMLVPIRETARVIGLLSIHSYTPQAYDRHSLETLQAMADHCAGALNRLHAQEALSQSEANYRLLIERSPDAILLHRDGMFVYANPAGLKLLGAEKPHQVLGRPVFDIVPPENRDVVGRRIRQAVEGGMTPPLEQKILRLDGTPLDAEVTSIPFTYEGKPAVQSIMRDITERKQLEQQLRQSQKMDAIGQLAGGVAHDFNNMLAVIRGNAELLLMDPDQHTPETRECLKQVTAASERAANLTRQLLAFSRKQVMQSRPLILNDVMADLTKMLKRIIGEHIDLQCRYAAQLPFVQADAGMIEQVLLNLAVNARDAMPRGGQLLITTTTVSFDAAYARAHPEAGAGEFVCLTVGDTGTGIAPEHLPRIFEPFFTTKEVGKGTGLGLATVYGIVTQHRGWVEVASQPGAGATFKIFLPAIATPASAAATPQAEADLPRGTETILLVEDDYGVRMITRRVLESHGYKICEATAAGEALDLWRSRAEEIALLLTDIVLPQGVTGRDLAEQLRAQRPALKVVFMSGYSADVIGKDTDFFRRTRSSVLQKPISSRALLETVRRCLDVK